MNIQQVNIKPHTWFILVLRVLLLDVHHPLYVLSLIFLTTYYLLLHMTFAL